MLAPWPGYAPPANAVFTPEELDARIAWHAARVEREMAELPPLRTVGRTPRRDLQSAMHLLTEQVVARSALGGRLPDGRDWWSLKVVNCRECRTLLLSRSEEHMRGLVSGTRRASLLPPPSFTGADGWSYCERCHGSDL